MANASYSSANNADLGETSRPSIPLEILKAMREDAAAEVVALSGGEHLRFHDEQELERGLSIVARDIQNGYTLSFYPLLAKLVSTPLRFRLPRSTHI
jgi:hypothetical protein